MREHVKALRSFARAHGFAQVRDDAGKLRKRLRAMDLLDLQKKMPLVGKTTLKARLRSLLFSKKSKGVAKNLVVGLRKT